MKIIGAGFPRTGTMSMQAALNHLGFNCYHMKNLLLQEKDHVQKWSDFIIHGNKMNWQELFKDYQATVDAPACFYFEEIKEEFPGAKVILTERDSNRWFESYSVLLTTVSSLPSFLYKLPVIGKFINFAFQMLEKNLGLQKQKEDYIQMYEAHNEYVKKTIPKEKLLVFRVQDGWGPLCKFLNCDIPDIPFPHLNQGNKTIKKIIRKAALKFLFKVVLFVSILLLISILIQTKFF